MENLLNFQKHRWDHNEDPKLCLRRLEMDARAFLASNKNQTNTTNLFVILMSTPYVAGFPHHGRHVVKNEQVLALTFASGSETSLPYRLPSATSDCACANLRGLSVDKIYLSGSVREGTFVRVWSEIGSDVDAMFQLAPVAVLDAASCSSNRTRRDSTGVELSVQPTANRGYVILKHVRGSQCRHRDALTFSTDRAVNLLGRFHDRLNEDAAAQRAGPALSTSVPDFQQHWKNIDLVPCLVTHGYWPRGEFATRKRPSGQPSAALVHKLSELPVFLVPVGFPGSATERDEWRVSFSRHEYILLRDMSEAQRSCLTLLKTCKAVLDLHALKSYHLKTALIWLCESRPRSQWTREVARDSLLRILDYLETCVRRRRLPCYFWPQMNVFATRNDAQMEELAADIKKMKSRLLSCSLALVAQWLGVKVSNVAARLLSGEAVVPDTDNTAIRLLTDTFMKSLFRGEADGWGFLHGLATCALGPGALPFPFGSCFPFLFRSVRASVEKSPDSPEDGGHALGMVVALLKAIQGANDAETPDGGDSWMVRY